MILRKVEKKDWEILLEWRNDELTRKNSLHSDIISENEHKRWFFDPLANSNRKIYIVEEDDTIVGTVRVDKENNKRAISWTVAPEHRGKGYAKKMVKMLVDSLDNYDNVIAIIKMGNIASIKVAEYAGLKLLKENNDLLVYYKT